MDNTKEPQTLLSFCSGYGGIERGLDYARVDYRVIAYVEIEAFVIANLVAKMEEGRLDTAPVFTDLKTFPAHIFRGTVDIITGGYPCQPFSAAGKRMGKQDTRHLWPFIRKHIQTIKPQTIFLENVYGHISLGLSSVISDLEEDGYSATWGIFSAEEVGAPHQRKRIFIMANANGAGQQPSSGSVQQPEVRHDTGRSSKELANTECEGLEGHTGVEVRSNKPGRINSKKDRLFTEGSILSGPSCVWETEPQLGRMVDGCSNWVDRIRILGNGVVPQTAARAWAVLSSRFK